MNVEFRNRQRLLRVDARLLKSLARQALELVDAPDNCNLSIALVTDAAIAKLNTQYHATSGPTDILTFDYGEGQGELIISVEHVVANARRFRTKPSRELAVYIIHGILHFHGYDDHTAQQRRRMRGAERRLLRNLSTSFELKRLALRA
jgi:probable rRNA maturation factor